MKVGFIGLGVMGQSMAGHILEAGFELNVYNRTPSKANELLEKGAVWFDSAASLAQASDVIITILGYPSDVEQVYFGSQGIFAGIKKDSILIDMTTSTPSLARKIAEEATSLGVKALDAPVSGGDKGAKEGRLTVMVGGESEILSQISPILDTFSGSIVHHGPNGAGQAAKVVNQIMVAGTMLGMAEVLAYTKAAGLSYEKVIDTLGGGAASNWSLANYGPRIIAGDYSPGFFVKHFIKDLKIALDEAEAMQLKLPMTELAYQLYSDLSQKGYDSQGTQAIIKLWWD